MRHTRGVRASRAMIVVPRDNKQTISFWRVLNLRSHPRIALTNTNGDVVSNYESAQLLNDAF